MRFRLLRNFQTLALNISVAAFFLANRAGAASTADVTVTFSGPTEAVTAGSVAQIYLNALNTSTEVVSWTFPREIRCRLTTGTLELETGASLAATDGSGGTEIAAGHFARRAYDLRAPANLTGEVLAEPLDFPSVRLVLNILPARTAPVMAPSGKNLVSIFKGRKEPEAEAYDPENFFKAHIFGYEPFYFIAGTKSPNAKFQISFKYRLLNDFGWLAQKQPWMRGFHLAYTQTSLWDWNGPSAPFYDSSYKPEFLYSWERLVGGAPTNWFRLDMQGGVHHESNGKGGADSRSLNIAYLRPTLVFGRDTGLQLSLTPRAWVYLGDLSDNPDIAEYRGYADLRAVLGWKRGLQLSVLGRLGKDARHGSAQVDVSYPLMVPPYGSLSIYLYGQYFTGYGESLLGYNKRTDVFRAGISLYR